jgi:hypothetical protein
MMDAGGVLPAASASRLLIFSNENHLDSSLPLLFLLFARVFRAKYTKPDPHSRDWAGFDSDYEPEPEPGGRARI